MRFVQQAQGIQQLLGKYPDKGSAQSTELVLFDQLIKINAEQFECETQMLTVDECVLETKQVMVVILVILAVEQIQHRNFHHTLVEVGRLVLDDFDSHYFTRFQVLAFHNLAEGTLT
jgi:hypothetical protein